MDRAEKERQVDFIANTFEKAKSVIFANYRGLDVGEITELRHKLKESEGTFKVIKNRLAKRAAEKIKIEGLDDFLVGPTAIASSDADPVIPAKVLVEFAKDHEVLEIKAGYMNGELLDIATINTLAQLPSRDVLYAKMLSSLNAPATNMAMALAAIPRSLVTVLNAVKEKKEQEQ